MRALGLLLFLGCAASVCWARNIVLILTDDLDSVLDGMTPLNRTRKLIGSEGVTFTNAFAAVPICCPNRASILTGRYQHNHRTYNNSVKGGCNSQEWQDIHEKNTFAAILKEKMKYNTFYAGKYLNQYGIKSTGGVRYIPPGWDQWYGLVGNSRYYNYSLSANGVEKKYGDSAKEYLTDVIANLATEYIKKQKKDQPFLMMLAPPAPHAPFTPAARHNDAYKDVVAKRTRSFNYWKNEDKHWLMRMGPSPLPYDVLPALDNIYRRRWETLLTVDEMVANVYNQLKLKQLLDDTYIIFTSDNGYHVGQFSQPFDKRQPYETDIRVPLLIRGPDMPRNSQHTGAASSVDLFATILEIAGIEQPSDGLSLLHADDRDRTVLIEYQGERSERAPNSGCPTDMDPNLSQCSKDFACKCQDAANNTFTCVRRVSTKENNVFCIFKEDEEFVESYNLLTDEFQLDNIGPSMKGKKRYRFRKRVKKMAICKDRTCIATNPPIKHR